MLWSSTLGKKNCNKKVYTEVEQIFCDILQYSCNSRLTHLRRSGPDTDPVSDRPDPPTLLPATFHMFNFYCDPLNFTNVEVKNILIFSDIHEDTQESLHIVIELWTFKKFIVERGGFRDNPHLLIFVWMFIAAAISRGLEH
jgi:hypothetical protein